jgi:hypothetical protein
LRWGRSSLRVVRARSAGQSRSQVTGGTALANSGGSEHLTETDWSVTGHEFMAEAKATVTTTIARMTMIVAMTQDLGIVVATGEG